MSPQKLQAHCQFLGVIERSMPGGIAPLEMQAELGWTLKQVVNAISWAAHRKFVDVDDFDGQTVPRWYLMSKGAKYIQTNCIDCGD